MKSCNAYESTSMHLVMEEGLRPGGLQLTERAIKLCRFSEEASILDLGCGWGATIGLLQEKYNIRAVGLDPSEKLLKLAKERYPSGSFVLGSGKRLPFKAESFHGVFSECTMSLMEDKEETVQEVFRVLKEDGYFVISDVYAQKPEGLKNMDAFGFNSCMRGLYDLQQLQNSLKRVGFSLLLLEDHSPLLKELLVKIIFTFGSMDVFWNRATESCIDGAAFQEALRGCKPGYYMLIARKVQKYDE